MFGIYNLLMTTTFTSQMLIYIFEPLVKIKKSLQSRREKGCGK